VFLRMLYASLTPVPLSPFDRVGGESAPGLRPGDPVDLQRVYGFKVRAANHAVADRGHGDNLAPPRFRRC
jgi:hypothetical protein